MSGSDTMRTLNRLEEYAFFSSGGTPSLELTPFPINVVPTPLCFPQFRRKIFPEVKSANERYRPKSDIQHIDVIT